MGVERDLPPALAWRLIVEAWDVEDPLILFLLISRA